MAASIPSTEPTVIHAGDTIPWTKTVPDYPSTDGWTLSYSLRLQNGSGSVDATATPSGQDYTVTIPAATTAPMTPGTWVWAAYVTKALERYLVGSGTLLVLQNIAKIDAQVDLRSPARKAYDNALAAWATFATAKMVVLNGRTYTARDAADLIVYVDRCKADYALEVGSANGVENPRRIGVRFVRP